jgi:hypothetical protein
VFDYPCRNGARVSDRPGPAFIALRAAALGIDDVSRIALRAWVMHAVNFRGDLETDAAPPADAGAAAIALAMCGLSLGERATYRRWMAKWTDFTGRVITPSEQKRRMAELLATRKPIDER